jgi:hypothetical protein
VEEGEISRVNCLRRPHSWFKTILRSQTRSSVQIRLRNQKLFSFQRLNGNLEPSELTIFEFQ